MYTQVTKLIVMIKIQLLQILNHSTLYVIIILLLHQNIYIRKGKNYLANKLDNIRYRHDDRSELFVNVAGCLRQSTSVSNQ